MSKLHLPEFRVTESIPGVAPETLNGYYVRAENEQAARDLARKAGLGVTRALVVQRWKEPSVAP